MSHPFSLSGATALVTGAGSRNGIGFASAKFLCEMGATVYISGASERVVTRVSELNQLGFAAFGSPADLTNPDEAEKLVKDAVATLGSLNILVNNAGMTSVDNPVSVSGESGDISSLTIDGWSKSLARNLDTAFYVSKYALPHLMSSEFGRIIMVSSITGPVMAMKNEVAYGTSKAALVGLTKSLAIDLAKFPITVNAVAPGWIATDAQTENESLNGIATPIGRSATPGEVAAAIGFLAAQEASYVTGQLLIVDGGNSIQDERA